MNTHEEPAHEWPKILWFMALPDDPEPLVSMHFLGPHHHFLLLAQAIRSVLSLNQTVHTFAQLIDGLPLMESVYRMLPESDRDIDYHPLMTHTSFTECGDALQRARLLCRTFDQDTLRFDQSVMQRFADAEVGSNVFKKILIELVARAIHQIAILLFESDDKVHSEDEIDKIRFWARNPFPKERRLFVNEHWHGHDDSEGDDPGQDCHIDVVPQHELAPFIPFYHRHYYTDYEIYRHGLSDLAAYWAEDCIFGGVFVFRRISPDEIWRGWTDIYLNCSWLEYDGAVWQLKMAQLDEIMDFLCFSTTKRLPQGLGSGSPFPFTSEDVADYCMSPTSAVKQFVFRELWEGRAFITQFRQRRTPTPDPPHLNENHNIL